MVKRKWRLVASRAGMGGRRRVTLNQVRVGCTDYDVSCAFYEALWLADPRPPRYSRFETPTGETI